jgi:phosphate transport system protein
VPDVVGIARWTENVTVRAAYHDELAEITSRLVEITRRVGELMQRASTALLSGNVAVADQVISEASELALLRTNVEAVALRLMAQQQPVATDLRALLSAFDINYALERMGALVVHIAKIAANSPGIGTCDDVLPMLNRAANLAGRITGLTTDLLATRDLALLSQIEETENAMDALRSELFTATLAPSWAHGVELCVRVSEAARYYERYADHAESIAYRVAFIVNGKPD